MKRTGQQNRALHLYITKLAEALDESGHDMREVIKLPIKPTAENVKENMVRPVMIALYPEIKSTTDLDTKQMQELYEVLNRATGERLGIYVEWPCLDTLNAAVELNHGNR